MNKKEYIQQLADRFFAGETTLAEEQRLYRFFRGDDIPTELLPLREMFVSLSLIGIAPDKQTTRKTTTQSRLKVSFRRKLFGVAAAVAVILAMSTTLFHIDREQNYCKAYVNDRLVTDKAAIMSSVAATMSDIGEAGQTGADRQLHDLFGCDDGNADH